MNDVVKSIVMLTLLAMVGGLTVGITNVSVHGPHESISSPRTMTIVSPASATVNDSSMLDKPIRKGITGPRTK